MSIRYCWNIHIRISQYLVTDNLQVIHDWLIYWFDWLIDVLHSTQEFSTCRTQPVLWWKEPIQSPRENQAIPRVVLGSLATSQNCWVTLQWQHNGYFISSHFISLELNLVKTTDKIYAGVRQTKSAKFMWNLFNMHWNLICPIAFLTLKLWKLLRNTLRKSIHFNDVLHCIQESSTYTTVASITVGGNRPAPHKNHEISSKLVGWPIHLLT